MRTLLQAPEGGPSRSSKQAVRAIRLIGVMVANKSFVSKLQVEEQSKVLKFLLHRLHTTKAQAEAASIYWCLSRQHLFPQVLHQSAGELAVAINFGIPSSNEWKILRIVLACLSQLFDQIAADFSAKADLWLPSLWRLLLVQPKAPYTKEDRKKWAALRQQARETFTQVWSRHDSSLSELSEQIQKELLLELLGAPAESLPAGSHGLLSIMTAWTSACWDSGYAEKGTLQELSTEEREALAVDAIQAWCCFLNLLGAAFLTPGAAVGQAMIQVVCDVLIRSGSLVLLKAAVMAWKKLADTVINAGQLSMRQELVKPVIYMLKTCHTPAAYQASLGLWKHMVQLASKVTTGMCDTAGPGQDVVASSAVSQAIEWLVTSGPGEGILITLLHKVAKKCSGPAGRKAQQSANKPIQDAHKLVLTALVGETSRLMSHCSGRNTHGIQRVLLQTVANADCNGLHEANYEPWQKLCDDLNMCKQLEVQQHFLLHIITEALAHKEASRHQAALAMWNYLLQLVCPNPGKASTTQRSLFVSFAAPMLLVLAAMPSEGLDQVQPLWLQVLDRWLDMWPHIWMLAALMSKLRQQIGIDSSVIMSQAGAQPSGIVQMQLLATILQKMCCIMAELYRSDSPAGLRSFIQYHKSAEELYSELCHQMVALPAQDEELIKAAPPHGHVKILLPDDIKMPLKALLPREWSRVCSMYWLVLSTGDPQLAYQTRWQPGHASIRAELSSSVYLPMTLDVCSALMRAITTYMLAVDAFAESAEEMTAAVAFAAQVLQIPLEFVKQSVAAGGISIVTEMSAGPESDVAERPEGPSKDEGQDARGTAGASKEVHADMGEGAVELSGQDVVSWYMPWQDLYLVVAQVARRSQACAADHTAALATYLLSFAAAMRQSNVDKNAAAASMPLWTCFLAADASVIVKQACRDSPAPAAEAHRPVCLAALCIKLLETSLEHVCHAALASPGIGMGYLSALLDAVPDAFASFADTQPLMTAVAACIQLADHVTDRRTTLQLEAAWKAVIAAFNPRSMLQLSQVSIDELFLQPMATALKYGSQAMRDMTQEFWGNSGIGSVLSAFDVSIVESALAPPEHPSNLVQLALRKAMSAGILTTMSAMTAMSDSGSLEIEMDADPADAPHTADAMAEGDSVDAIANVALAPAQAKAVVKTQVQLAAVSMDKMARTSCGHATRPMPANQARTAEVKAVHTKRVTFAATSPNKAATSHVATAVTGAKQVQRRRARGVMRLCKLLPNSGPLKSKLSEAKEEMSRAVEATSQNLSRLPSKPGQAAHAFAGTASLPSSAHHIGHGAQAAQGAEAMQEQAQLHVTSFESVHGSALHMPAIASKGSTKGGLRRLPGTLTKTKQATPVTDLQHEIQPADCITSAAHALSKRDQSIQPDGSKLQGQPRRCEQAGCSIPVGTEVQAPGTQPQAQEEPRLQSSSPKCLHDQITVDQPSQAVLAVVTGHEGPYLPNQACLHSTSEPDNCDKRPAEYSPQAREVACKRTRESMHDDSLEKQNVPTQGTYDTELAEADLQDFGEAHLSLLQASLPVDGLIGQGRQKATEEVASGRSSAAAHSTDVHDSPGLYLGLDNEHQVLEDTHSGTVATVKVGSLVASSVATTEVVQATAVQHEYVSTAQSARPEQDACFSEMPSKSLGLTPVDAVVNRDQINRDILEMSALKKARNGLHVDQEPRQHPEGTGTSIQDMQVCAKWPVQVGLASPPSLSMQDLSAGSELVQQILQAVNIDAKTILPEAAKQASVVASLQLKKAYCSGYKDAKHEIAEHCMKTSG
ncbi:hypothetical protein WJX79_004363 [Trebouxia sp. C0005]